MVEEHVKSSGRLGFVPGLTPEQTAVASGRGGWSRLACRPSSTTPRSAPGSRAAEELVAYLKSVEQRFPGLEYVPVSNSMGSRST